MAVSQKIKTGDSQPKGGRAIVGVGGARALAAADVVDAIIPLIHRWVQAMSISRYRILTIV